MSNKLPNFFIIGAPKAGTTALRAMLASHPDVFMCPIKEPHFFSTDFQVNHFTTEYKRNKLFDLTEYLQEPTLKEVHIAHVQKTAHYKELFRDVHGERVIGEASSGYLYSKDAAKNIHSKIPEAKIVMILREPVERAISHFNMTLSSGWSSTNSFLEGTEQELNNPSNKWGSSSPLYIALGMYYKQVERYIRVFPREQLKVVNYSDWKNNNRVILEEILSFLDTREGECSNIDKAYNKSSNIRFNSLNYLMTKMGVSTTMRKATPSFLKPMLKKIWHSPKQNIRATEKDRHLIARYFTEDIDKMEKLLWENGLTPKKGFFSDAY